MKWILVRRDADGAVEDVEIEADTPADAIEELRGRLPEGSEIRSIRRLDYGLPDPESGPTSNV